MTKKKLVFINGTFLLMFSHAEAHLLHATWAQATDGTTTCYPEIYIQGIRPIRAAYCD